MILGNGSYIINTKLYGESHEHHAYVYDEHWVYEFCKGWATAEVKEKITSLNPTLLEIEREKNPLQQIAIYYQLTPYRNLKSDKAASDLLREIEKMGQYVNHRIYQSNKEWHIVLYPPSVRISLACRYICETLASIPIGNTIAFGSSLDDLEILRAANRGIAVKNSDHDLI